ncbi:MAG: tsf [Candidatus Doudnabacteria bacterium]|nr:tsf [Candidatus Doudnabacteria bacterium]
MELLKELRDLTGAGMMDIKAALDEAGNDKEKAIDILRKKGQSKMLKKSDRIANEGLIESYIHAGGKVGVLLELNTETDFVARTDDFKNLAKELALHIAAANPLYVTTADVPNEVIEKEKEIYKEQAKDSGKPEAVVEKMIEGKLAKYFEETCLMEQPFVKEPEKKIKDFIAEKAAKLGENVVVRRFTRYHLGN